VESVDLIMDRATGRSKGFAFVTMGSQSDLEKAIQMFNGYSLDDRQLTVNIARPREERGPGDFGGGGGARGGGARGSSRPGGRQQNNRTGGSRRY
jgi:RNA recognition motif-containing protein